MSCFRLLLVATLAAVPARAQAPPIGITYLANEGVILEGRGGRVLIDALFGDGLPDYAVVPPSSRDSLEQALGRYGGRALVLTTHPHRDHFDSAAVARYLLHNRGATALGPPSLAPSPALERDLGWVRVRPVAIPHGPSRRPIGHTAWLVMLDGTTTLHIGDANGSPRDWPSLGLTDSLDVALVPFWYALDDKAFRELIDALAPRLVVLLHVPVASSVDDRDGWETRSREVSARYQRVRIPSVPGEVVSRGRAR